MASNTLFISDAGKVVLFQLDTKDAPAIPASITITTKTVDTQSGAATAGTDVLTKLILVTSYNFSQTTNHQLAKSLGKYNYLYTFGDQPGKISVSGILIPQLCNNDSKTDGVSDFLNLYKQYKVSTFDAKSSTAVPLININLATNVNIDGILVSSTVTMDDPATRVAKFTMDIISLDF